MKVFAELYQTWYENMQQWRFDMVFFYDFLLIFKVSLIFMNMQIS